MKKTALAKQQLNDDNDDYDNEIKEREKNRRSHVYLMFQSRFFFRELFVVWNTHTIHYTITADSLYLWIEKKKMHRAKMLIQPKRIEQNNKKMVVLFSTFLPTILEFLNARLLYT